MASNPKTAKDIKAMAQGGEKLAEIKSKLFDAIKVGVSAAAIESLACELIDKTGGKASFKMVPDYFWATCINVNDGIVHGVPHETIVFEKGDIVSVDMGLFYRGFHTDTSITKGLEVNKEIENFIKVGETAVYNAIAKVLVGGRIFDLSEQLEKTVRGAGYTPVKQLTGHGIGRNLHEDPYIPCIIDEKREKTPEIREGDVYAIEVMYTLGSGGLVKEDDGWTISTSDGKIAGLFEETVAATKNGPQVLTKMNHA